jgi:hypothetical protein
MISSSECVLTAFVSTARFAVAYGGPGGVARSVGPRPQSLTEVAPSNSSGPELSGLRKRTPNATWQPVPVHATREFRGILHWHEGWVSKSRSKSASWALHVDAAEVEAGRDPGPRPGGQERERPRTRTKGSLAGKVVKSQFGSRIRFEG